MPEYFRHYGRHEPTQQNHTPYSYGHGEPDKTLWEICHKEPARLKRVMDAMDTVTHGPMIGKEYDFSWLKEKIADPAQKDRILFVDVGAGKGHIAKAILQENPFIPHDRVALEDRDEVMKQVAANPDSGLTGVKLQSHDFHKEQPIKSKLSSPEEEKIQVWLTRRRGIHLLHLPLSPQLQRRGIG